MFRFLLFTVFCVSPLLAQYCGDNVYSHGVRDINCDYLVLEKDGDLLPNIQPVDKLKVVNVWLNNFEGGVYETSFPKLGGQITSLKFQTGKLSNFVLPEMPKLEELEISRTTLPKLTADSFKNAKNLKVLILRENKGATIDSGLFKNLQNLKNLIIQNQDLTRLSKGNLEGLKNLEELHLAETKLNKIDENAFESSNKIIRLSLKEPTLKKIEPNTFKPLKKLQALDILRTNLDSFSLDLLKEQKDLNSLGLPTKFLVQIGLEKLKQQLPKLSEIRIQEEDEDKDEIKKIKEVAKKLNITVKGRIILN